MFKKILLPLLLLLLVLSTAAFADTGSLDITAQNVNVTNGTDFIDVKVSVENNPGVAMLKFRVSYDSNYLTLSSYAKSSEVFSSSTVNDAKNPLVFVANIPTDTTNVGELFTLTFAISENCPDGVYPITFEPVEAYDWEYNDVTTSYTNGSVTVSSSTPVINVPTTLHDLHTIRTVSPTGLRFQASIPSEHTANRIGWIVTTKSRLDDKNISINDFTMESDVKWVGKDDYNFDIDAGVNHMYSAGNGIDIASAVLINVAAKNYGATLVARPYAIDAYGTHYGEPYAKSMTEVAQIMKNSGDYASLTATQKAVIDAIINGQEIQ